MTKRKDDPETPDVDESVEDVPETPDPAKHILVDAGKTGTYSLELQPRGFDNDRRLLFGGQNIETVDIHPTGVRMYRAM